MEYPAQSQNNAVNFPNSAYRWILLDSANNCEDDLSAVYKHNKVNAWCVIRKSDTMNSIDVYIFTKENIPSYIHTDMECLINLITSYLNSSKTFVIKNQQYGNVADAYKLIN